MLAQQVRIRLATIFVALVLLSAGSAAQGTFVFAQQQAGNSTSGTTQDLPDCPPLGDQPIGPPTSPIDITAPATCKVKVTTVDLKELIDQGHPLSEMGLGGDPDIPADGHVDQASQAPDGGAMALYLPFLAGYKTTQNSTETVESAISGPIDIDLSADIPYCPDDFYTKPAESGPLPPKPDAPRCLLKTTTVDLKALLDQGYTLAEMGLGGDPPVPADLGDKEKIGAAAIQGVQNSFSQNMWSTSSSNTTIDQLYGFVSLFKPTLINNGNWSNYNYYNRLSVGSSSQVQCGTLSKVNVGVVYGRFGPQTITGSPQIVGEYYTSAGCQGVYTGITVNGSVYLRAICGNNSCVGEAYLNGSWGVVVPAVSNNWPTTMGLC